MNKDYINGWEFFMNYGTERKETLDNARYFSFKGKIFPIDISKKQVEVSRELEYDTHLRDIRFYFFPDKYYRSEIITLSASTRDNRLHIYLFGKIPNAFFISRTGIDSKIGAIHLHKFSRSDLMFYDAKMNPITNWESEIIF